MTFLPRISEKLIPLLEYESAHPFFEYLCWRSCSFEASRIPSLREGVRKFVFPFHYHKNPFSHFYFFSLSFLSFFLSCRSFEIALYSYAQKIGPLWGKNQAGQIVNKYDFTSDTPANLGKWRVIKGMISCWRYTGFLHEEVVSFAVGFCENVRETFASTGEGVFFMWLATIRSIFQTEVVPSSLRIASVATASSLFHLFRTQSSRDLLCVFYEIMSFFPKFERDVVVVPILSLSSARDLLLEGVRQEKDEGVSCVALKCFIFFTLQHCVASRENGRQKKSKKSSIGVKKDALAVIEGEDDSRMDIGDESSRMDEDEEDIQLLDTNVKETVDIGKELCFAISEVLNLYDRGGKLLLEAVNCLALLMCSSHLLPSCPSFVKKTLLNKPTFQRMGRKGGYSKGKSCFSSHTFFPKAPSVLDLRMEAARRRELFYWLSFSSFHSRPSLPSFQCKECLLHSPIQRTLSPPPGGNKNGGHDEKGKEKEGEVVDNGKEMKELGEEGVFKNLKNFLLAASSPGGEEMHDGGEEEENRNQWAIVSSSFFRYCLGKLVRHLPANVLHEHALDFVGLFDHLSSRRKEVRDSFLPIVPLFSLPPFSDELIKVLRDALKEAKVMNRPGLATILAVLGEVGKVTVQFDIVLIITWELLGHLSSGESQVKVIFDSSGFLFYSLYLISSFIPFVQSICEKQLHSIAKIHASRDTDSHDKLEEEKVDKKGRSSAQSDAEKFFSQIGEFLYPLLLKDFGEGGENTIPRKILAAAGSPLKHSLPPYFPLFPPLICFPIFSRISRSSCR